MFHKFVKFLRGTNDGPRLTSTIDCDLCFKSLTHLKEVYVVIYDRSLQNQNNNNSNESQFDCKKMCHECLKMTSTTKKDSLQNATKLSVGDFDFCFANSSASPCSLCNVTGGAGATFVSPTALEEQWVCNKCFISTLDLLPTTLLRTGLKSVYEGVDVSNAAEVQHQRQLQQRGKPAKGLGPASLDYVSSLPPYNSAFSLPAKPTSQVNVKPQEGAYASTVDVRLADAMKDAASVEKQLDMQYKSLKPLRASLPVSNNNNCNSETDVNNKPAPGDMYGAVPNRPLPTDQYNQLPQEFPCDDPQLAIHLWYHGKLDRNTATELVLNGPEGAFLVRDSNNAKCFTLVCHAQGGNVLNILVQPVDANKEYCEHTLQPKVGYIVGKKDLEIYPDVPSIVYAFSDSNPNAANRPTVKISVPIERSN